MTFTAFSTRLDLLSDADAAATLTAVAAARGGRGRRPFPAPVTRLLVTGGGRHNATLMAELRRRIACPVEPGRGCRA